MVPSATRQNNYTANGSTTTFAITYPFQFATDIVVTQTVSNVASQLLQGRDYTVYGAGQSNGGSIVCTSAPPNGATINIARVEPLTQLTSLRTQGNYSPASIELALDKSIMGLQQLNDAIVAIQQGNLNPPAPPAQIVDYVAAKNAKGTNVGAKGDGKGVAAANIGGSSTTLTSPSNPFTSTAVDGGKTVVIALDNGSVFVSTISTVTNSGQAILTAGPATAATSQPMCFGTDDTNAIQAAINAAYASNSGPGQLRLYFPAGLYIIAGQLSFDLTQTNVRIEGDGWGNSCLYHVKAGGAGNKGCLYFTSGTEVDSGLTQAKTNGWYDIHGLAFGSLNGCAAWSAACNGRITDCYLFQAGTGTNTDSGQNNAYLFFQFTGGGAGEYSHLRVGPSNMGIENVFAFWIGIPNRGSPPNGILGINNTSTFVAEIKFHHIQCDGFTTSNVIRFETQSALAGACFGLEFIAVTSKVDSTRCSAGTSAFYFDGVDAQLTDCLTEQNRAGDPMVVCKSTYQPGTVVAVNCKGYGANFYVDESNGNSGSWLKCVSCLMWKADRLNAGAGGTSYFELDACDYRQPLGAGTFYGYNNRFDKLVNGVFSADDSPLLAIGNSGTAASGITLPFHSTSGAAYLLAQRSRGTILSPAAVQATDDCFDLEVSAYINGAFQPVADVSAVAQTINGNNVQGQLLLQTANTSGTLINSLDVNNARLHLPAGSGLTVDNHADSSGSPGAATINAYCGRSAVANGASSVVITNSTVTQAGGGFGGSLVIVTPVSGGGDTAAPAVKNVTVGSGSFTVTLTGATNGTWFFAWMVIG